MQAGYELQQDDYSYVEDLKEEYNALYFAVARRRRDMVEILLAHCTEHGLIDSMVNDIDDIDDSKNYKAETPCK